MTRTELEILKEVKVFLKGGCLKQHGLCSCLWFVSGVGELHLVQNIHNAFLHWPKHTGSLEFPVPHPVKAPSYAWRIARYSGTFWDETTEYGRNRWDLLEYLISYFSEKERKDAALLNELPG